MRRFASVLAATSVALAAAALGAGGASAATVAACTDGTPPLQIVVDQNSGGNRRRAISVANAGGTSASAVFPVNLIVTRNGVARTVVLKDLQGEYRYTAARGERAGFAAVYFEDRSGYGGVTFGNTTITQVDLLGVSGVAASQLTSLLATLGLPPVATSLINVVLPPSSVPGSFASAGCLRTQAASVAEAASSRSRASARRAKVRRTHRAGKLDR